MKMVILNCLQKYLKKVILLSMRMGVGPQEYVDIIEWGSGHRNMLIL